MKNKKLLPKNYHSGFLLLFLIIGFGLIRALPFDGHFIQTSVLKSSNPVVVATFPVGGSKISKNYRVFGMKFAIPMSAATLNTTTLTLKDKNNTAVPGTVTYDANTGTAYFKANSNLNITASPSNNPFTFSLGDGAKDIKNNPVGQLNVQYTIENRLDTSSPAMAWSNPAPNLNGVDPLVGTIDIAYKKPLDPNTVTATSWTYTASPTSTFSAKTMYNPLTQAVSIQTTTPLAENTRYTITLNNTIKDVNGNAFPGSFSFTFTTGSNNTTTPYVKWTDFRTNGIDVNFDFTAPLLEGPAINPANYSLKCGSSSIDLSGASFGYDPEDRQVSIDAIVLPEKSACTLTLGAAIVGLNGVALDSNSLTQTTAKDGVHKPFSGESHFSDFAATSGGSWFKKEVCVDCKGLWDNPSVKFYNRINVSAASIIAGDTTDYTFTFPVTVPVTTGDAIQILAPASFDISSVSLVSQPNIYNDVTKIAKITSISSDLTKHIISLPLQIAGDGVISGGLLSFIIKDIVNPEQGGDNYTFRYQTSSSAGVIEGPNAFNPIIIKATGDGEVLLTVLDINTANPIANVQVLMRSRDFGMKEFTTNDGGDVILSGIPINPILGTDVDAWIDATQTPGGYLPLSASTHFHLTTVDPVQLDNLFLFPAKLQIKGTINHSNIGVDGETKANLNVKGAAGVFTKTITLEKTGSTPYTFDLDTEGEYTLSVERFVDTKSISNPTFFLPPSPETLQLTAAKSPLTINITLQQTNRRITGTVLSQDGTAITNANVTATLENSEKGSRFSSDSKTDSSGFYSITVAPGNYKVDADVPGFAGKNEKTVQVKAGDITVNFVINKPTNALSGNVSDSTANPIQGALVNCFNTNRENSTALTDSNGDYVMYVSNGVWSCEAKSRRLGTIPPGDGVVAVNRTVNEGVKNMNFIYKLDTFATIRGSLKSESGSLVIGSWIGVEKIDKTTKKNIGLVNSAQTDQNSNFSIPVAKNNASETYRLKALAGNAKFVIADNIDVSSTDANLGVLTYPTEKTLTVGVKSVPGNIGNVAVNIQNLTTNNFNTASVRLSSGNGSSTVNLPNANYSARLVVPGFDEKIINFTVAGADISINFDYDNTGSSAFSIQVKDSASALIQGAFVEAFEQTGGHYASATTDVNGTATLNVAPGAYILKAGKQGFVSASIVSSENTRNYNLTLKDASALISLTVKDNNNAVVPYAWVDAVTTDGSNQWTGGKALGDGTLNLNVSAGSRWNITARSANGAYGTKSDVAAGTLGIIVVLNQIKSDFIPVNPVAQIINPTRDNVVSSDVVDLTIGAGALGNTTTDTNLMINKTTSIPTTNTTTALGGIGVEVSSTDITGRPVNTLNSDAIIEVKYDKNQILALLNTNTVRIDQLNAPLSSYDTIKGTWTTLDGVTIYVSLQEKTGDNYTTTTIQDFMTNFDAGKNYRKWNDFIVYYRGSTNHFSIFAPVIFAPVNNVLSYDLQKFVPSPRPSAGALKDTVLRRDAPCAPEESSLILILERFLRFVTLQKI